MSTKIPILSVYDEDGNKVEIPAIRGEKGDPGDPYVLTDADKQDIAAKVLAAQSTETWTFTLESGSTVTKTVVLK